MLVDAGVLCSKCCHCDLHWRGGGGGTIKDYKMADPGKTVLDTRFPLCSACESLTDEMDKQLKYPVCLKEGCVDYGKSHFFTRVDTPRNRKFYFE